MPAGHIPDDELDRYVMRQSHARAVSEIEEHLLLCDVCQARVEAIDRLVAALRLYRHSEPAARGAVS